MQRRRFLPIEYLEQSKGNQEYLNYLYYQYGDDIQGVMLHDKWIPWTSYGKDFNNKIEMKYQSKDIIPRALKEFMKGLGAAE